MVYKINYFMFVSNLVKMKRVIMGGVILAGLSAKSQVKISGRVTDLRSKPVVGASIALKNTYDGYF